MISYYDQPELADIYFEYPKVCGPKRLPPYTSLGEPVSQGSVFFLELCSAANFKEDSSNRWYYENEISFIHFLQSLSTLTSGKLKEAFEMVYRGFLAMFINSAKVSPDEYMSYVDFFYEGYFFNQQFVPKFFWHYDNLNIILRCAAKKLQYFNEVFVFLMAAGYYEHFDNRICIFDCLDGDKNVVEPLYFEHPMVN